MSERKIHYKNIYPMNRVEVFSDGYQNNPGIAYIEEDKTIIYQIIDNPNYNRYGHPKESVLNNLVNTKIYRTDELGTILIRSDGNNINISNFNTDTDGD